MRNTRHCAWLWCFVWLIAASPAFRITAADKGDKPPEVKEFESHVAEYVKLHKRLEGQLPPLKEKAQPEEIASHKKALAAVIKAARPEARPGDIFSPADAYLREVVKREMRGKAGASARETVKEGNPKLESPVKVPLVVNAYYPEQAPLSTVPPLLLLQLPKLPEEVEYRFVGRHLVLRDTKANIIVDFLLNVVPAT